MSNFIVIGALCGMISFTACIVGILWWLYRKFRKKKAPPKKDPTK